MRAWNKEVYGWLDLKVEDAFKDFNDLDEIIINNEFLRDENIEERIKAVSCEFSRHLHQKESLLRQKSRQKWLKEGNQTLGISIQS